MFSDTVQSDHISPREIAFSEFKKVAHAEQANGAETLSLFRLVPKFSTAPIEETNSWMVLFKAASRKGDTEALIEWGTELFNWSKDNGYHHN